MYDGKVNTNSLVNLEKMKTTFNLDYNHKYETRSIRVFWNGKLQREAFYDIPSARDFINRVCTSIPDQSRFSIFVPNYGHILYPFK